VADDPSGKHPQPLELTDIMQFKALSSLARQRILGVLVHRSATIGALSTELAMPRGSVGYHLRVLSDAGLIVPAQTVQVRGGTEIHWAAIATGFDLTAFAELAAPAELLRRAAQELAQADHGGMEYARVKRIRLRPETFAAFVDQLQGAFDDLDANSAEPDDQEGTGVTLAIALYRNQPKEDRS